MTSIFSTAGLARICARHGWLVIACWIVFVFLAAVAVATGGDVLTSDDDFTSEPESVRADNLIAERMPFEPGTGGAVETVIIRSETTTVDDPAFKATIEAIAADLRAIQPTVRDAPTYYDAVAAGDSRADLLVSSDRRTTLIPATVGAGADSFVDRIRELNRSYDGQGIEILTVGEETIDAEFERLLEEDLIAAEIYGLPAALIILVVVFGALVAAGVPLLLAIFSIIIAIGLTTLVGRVTDMSTYALNMITMIGLAVGIDYALFIVERYREERRRGRAKHEAIEIAGATASKAVLFSGLTVVFALMGMFLLPTTLFQSLGAGAILVVIVAVLASLTLVPAMVGLLGDRLDWPRRRTYDAATTAAQDLYDHETIHRGFWGRVARIVMARPLMSVLIVGALLVAAALPYFDINRGTAGAEVFPEGDVKRAFQILETDFSAGLIDPVGIVVDADRTPEIDTAIDELIASLAADPAFGPVTSREWNPAETLAVIEAPLREDANADASYDAIERLRGELIPRAFDGLPAEALVAGDAAENLDFNQLVEDGTPIVFLFVLGLSFLLLMVAFRSLVVPIKAIILNLLSAGATYGLMVLVFQKGYLVDFFGFQRTPTIEAWVPIFLFCILFGLSMDYHVFLLSRIREHYDQTGRNRESVAVGLQSTARLITGAALIMVVVFASFASGSLVMFQQFGFGLAVAVFLDATVIRSILVPASMVLLGDRNWYLPRWLHWLPDLRVEGTAPPPQVVPESASAD